MRGGFTHLAVHLLNRPEPIRQASLLWVLAANVDRPVSLVDGLDSLIGSGRGVWIERVRQLSNYLQQGYSLSESMRMAGELLPESTLLAIRVGESSGCLKQVLIEEAHGILQTQNGTRSLSIAWFLLMIAVFSLATLLLLTGIQIEPLGISIAPVLPRTVNMLNEFQVPVPRLLQPMVALGDVLRSFGWFLVLPMGSLFIAVSFFLLRWRFRYIVSGKLPFSHHSRRFWTPTILKSLAVAAAAGNTMSQCLHTILTELKPGRVSRSLSGVRQRIDSGEDFSNALATEGFLNKSEAAFLMSARTNRHIDWGLLQVADSISQRRKHRWKLAIAFAQPITVIACGAFIFWIAAALLLPSLVMMQRVAV